MFWLKFTIYKTKFLDLSIFLSFSDFYQDLSKAKVTVPEHFCQKNLETWLKETKFEVFFFSAQNVQKLGVDFETNYPFHGQTREY